MRKNQKAWVWLWVSVLILVLDQGAKITVVAHIPYAQPYFVFPFLNLYLQYNSGAAFSILNNAGGWQVILFSIISIIMSLVILVWLIKTPRSDRLQALALSLILGGALGNLIDRLCCGYVIDFFDFHWGHWHFATFNVADLAITLGVCFLIIRWLFFKVR